MALLCLATQHALAQDSTAKDMQSLPEVSH